MTDGRIFAHRSQGAQSADAQHEFLANAQIGIAAIELGGDVAVFRRVASEIGVEQIQRHPTDLHAPDPNP